MGRAVLCRDRAHDACQPCPGRIPWTRPGRSRALPSPRRAGFTLVELLVVVAIVLFLAAVSVPVLSHAVLRARVARVHSDLAQVEAALELYAGDHRGRYPPVTTTCEASGAVTDLQLPRELADGGYLPKRPGDAVSSLLRDPFRPGSTYQYVAPESYWQNGTRIDARYPVWIPDDFPRCRTSSGRVLSGRDTPLSWAIWSAGPGNVQNPRIPLDSAAWHRGGVTPGIIGRYRPRDSASFPTDAPGPSAKVAP